MTFIFLLLSFLLVVLVFWNLGSIVFHLLKYLQGELSMLLFPVTDHHSQSKYLDQYFPYYQQLPERSKDIFLKRVAHFVSSKNFIPRNLAQVTEEMKVLIAASAVQLTFGFSKVYLTHFTNILVYADDYYSTINRQFHKGEVNPRLKAIVLSWKSFVRGNLEDDGVNLGLHEMAHALSLENRIMNGEYNFLNGDVLAQWHKAAKREIAQLHNGTNLFFRAYGATNLEEFFAVAVENFFERPAELQVHNAKLYELLCTLLNQNPLILKPMNQAS